MARYSSPGNGDDAVETHPGHRNERSVSAAFGSCREVSKGCKFGAVRRRTKSVSLVRSQCLPVPRLRARESALSC